MAGWLVAAWQITLGFGIGVPFGYLLAGRAGRRRGLVSAVLRPPTPAVGRRLLAADLLGGAFFARWRC